MPALVSVVGWSFAVCYMWNNRHKFGRIRDGQVDAARVAKTCCAKARSGTFAQWPWCLAGWLAGWIVHTCTYNHSLSKQNADLLELSFPCLIIPPRLADVGMECRAERLKSICPLASLRRPPHCLTIPPLSPSPARASRRPTWSSSHRSVCQNGSFGARWGDKRYTR